MPYPETLELFFEQLPDGISADLADPWACAIVEATQPGRAYHVEAKLHSRDFWSSRESGDEKGVHYVPSLDQSKQWLPIDTGLPITVAALYLAESMLGRSYDFEGAGLSAIGRSRPRAGYAFCSGACYQLAVACGLPDVMAGCLPHPNLLAMIVQSYRSKATCASAVAHTAEATGVEVANLLLLAGRRQAMQDASKVCAAAPVQGEKTEAGPLGDLISAAQRLMGAGVSFSISDLRLINEALTVTAAASGTLRIVDASGRAVGSEAPVTAEKPRSPEWPALQKKFLAEHPLCCITGEKATVVHHVKPFHLFPALELDEKNLRPIKDDVWHRIVGHLGDWSTYCKDFDSLAGDFQVVFRQAEAKP